MQLRKAIADGTDQNFALPTYIWNWKLVTWSSSQHWQTVQNGTTGIYCEKAQIDAEEFIWGFVKHRWKWRSSSEISSAALLINCKSHNQRKSQAENVTLCREKKAEKENWKAEKW